RPEALVSMVRGYLEASRGRAALPVPPKALIAPHAGYIYSGPVAGSAYGALPEGRLGAIRRVVLVGPAHRVGFYGIAAPTNEAFETPLGAVPVDQEGVERVVRLPTVFRFDDPHETEHSLEVQLPFLQCLLQDFTVIPLLVGSASGEEVSRALEIVWGDEDTLVVVSSDLSHYLDYATAREMDTHTSEAIAALRPEAIQPGQACGHVPVQGLLLSARHHGLEGRVLDQRSSGDTAGPREPVVGYGAYAFH
ncbi:MAG: AmmeMemoRadiSam system protein B, partial [Ectothiorhodospira sp.]